MPATTALGDTNKFPKIIHARDPDNGKPVTEARNAYTSKIKTGKTDEVYIGADNRDFKKKMGDVAKELYVAKSNYVATNCPYDQTAVKEAGKRTFVKNGYAQIGGHEKDFAPAKTVTHAKKTTLASHVYIPDPPVPKKSRKLPDGEGVLTENPNFLTNPMKKGVLHGKKGQRGPYFDMPETLGNKYIESDYNIEKKILREELADHQSKLQEAPFYPLARQTKNKKRFYHGTFNNPMDVIGPIGTAPLPEKKVAPPEPNCHADDPPFRPFGTNTNNKRVHDTFSKFQGCNQGALNVVKRKPPPPDDAPPSFKMTHNQKGVPITSIATNTRNLKASYPQFFRK